MNGLIDGRAVDTPLGTMAPRIRLVPVNPGGNARWADAPVVGRPLCGAEAVFDFNAGIGADHGGKRFRVKGEVVARRVDEGGAPSYLGDRVEVSVTIESVSPSMSHGRKDAFEQHLRYRFAEVSERVFGEFDAAIRKEAVRVSDMRLEMLARQIAEAERSLARMRTAVSRHETVRLAALQETDVGRTVQPPRSGADPRM